MPTQSELFDRAQPGPPGLSYMRDFITYIEEKTLLDAIAALPLQEAQYKTFTAKRRTVSFGSSYDFNQNTLRDAPPLPEFLLPLRQKVADWLAIRAEQFEHALITEYQPGTQLGWHRDVPDFEIVVGISLAGCARMRFRGYPPQKRAKIFALELQPRSAYVLRNNARWNWQHSIAPTRELRYSITLRTSRADSGD